MKPTIAALCTAFFLACAGCAPQQNDQIQQPEQPAEQQPEQQSEQPEQQQPEQPQQNRPAAGETLSAFSTPITDDTPARVHNLVLAAESIAGTTVQPGETFSFNNTVGARTAERGYQKAKIIGHDKQIEEGYGGGVCQLSSTLYNAAEAGGFPIVERHEHQVEPTYIQKGRDAAVVYGQQDFRFLNNRNYPVVLHCLIGSGKVSVSVSAG